MGTLYLSIVHQSESDCVKYEGHAGKKKCYLRRFMSSVKAPKGFIFQGQTQGCKTQRGSNSSRGHPVLRGSVKAPTISRVDKLLDSCSAV